MINIQTHSRNYDGDLYYVYNRLLIAPSFWLLSILIIVTCLLPDYSIQAFKAFGFKLNSIFPGPGKNMIPENLKRRFTTTGSNNNDNSFRNYNDNHALETVQTTQL